MGKFTNGLSHSKRTVLWSSLQLLPLFWHKRRKGEAELEGMQQKYKMWGEGVGSGEWGVGSGWVTGWMGGWVREGGTIYTSENSFL